MNQAQIEKTLRVLNRLRTNCRCLCAEYAGGNTCKHMEFVNTHREVNIHLHTSRVFDERAGAFRTVSVWQWIGPVAAEAVTSAPSAERRAAMAPIDIAAEMARQGAPSTDAAACRRYGATEHRCSCRDKMTRNGSYTLAGRKVCKHQAHMMLQAQQQPASLTADPVARLIAAAAQHGDGGLQQLAHQAARKMGTTPEAISNALRSQLAV